MANNINSGIRMAVFDARAYDIEFFERENLSRQFQLQFYPMHLDADTVRLAAGSGAVCIFVNDFVTKEVADGLVAQGVRLIALRCAGYNNVDLTALYKRIHVVRVPAYSPHAVAEHAVAMILSLNRKTHRAYVRTRSGNFTLNGLLGFDLFGKTAGIVGTGQIGRIVAEILRGFGMTVVAHELFPNAAWAAKTGVEYVSLAELYQRSDVITLHCPLTADNVHMINSASLAQMREGVMIINTGRGKLINTPDLIEGVKTGRVGAAGLDVYEGEAAYFFDDYSERVVADDVLARLLTLPNVLVTGHQGFFTKEALTSIAATTFGNVASFFADKPLDNEICCRCGTPDCKKTVSGRCF